ncbi:MAG: GNAT family N-acetyltransferase [Hyphomicrobiaceae bacterium]|nr:GNAT family N-acetyltransferase [Hyphomicrobiaceae bacterium]
MSGAEASACQAAGLDLHVVRDFGAFEALEDEWGELFDRAARSHQLFQAFNWNWHWCRSYLDQNPTGSTLRLSVVVGRHDGRTVMIWPLIADRHLGVDYVCWMGMPVSQYSDVLVEDAPERMDWLRAGWRFIRSGLGADMICVPKVREDAVLSTLLRSLDLQPVLETEAPYADLLKAGSYDVYASRFSSRSRKNRRRQRRRLSEQGNVSVEVLTGGEAARLAAQEAIDLKREWLRKQGLISKAFSDDRIDAFFASAVTSPDKPAGCEVSVLKVGSETAAVAIGIVCQGRHVTHICAYNLDGKFAQSGAGGLITDETIRHCLDAGLDTFDMMGPGDAYKYEWTDAVVNVCDYAVPLTSRGHIYAALGTCTHAAKMAFENAPQRVRRVVLSVVGTGR